jgi:hypothetical protein
MLALMAGMPTQVIAQPWKSCWFNDQPMGCRDHHHTDGSLTIEWSDGLAMTYMLVHENAPRSTLRDSLGGLWHREVLAQGNAVFTHAQNGNRIMVPLRVDEGLGCPAAVRAQVDELYRWQLARQEQSGVMSIASQRERFTPQLFSLLERAYALTPADGRFVDFDPFSGTQVNTFGAALRDCRFDQQGVLTLRVAVQAGLRGRTAEPAQQLLYRFQHTPAEGWRIADIDYLQEPSFRLSTVLKELLEPRP